MEYIDYYKVLGISRDADKDARKKGMPEDSRKYHPDLNPGDEAAEKI